MTFLEIQTLAKSKIDDIEYDSIADNIIKNAINYAYILFATTVDKRSKSVALSVTDGEVTIPSDFASMIEIYDVFNSRPLSKLDYDLFQDGIIIRNSDILNVKLKYVYYPVKLTNDYENIVLKDIFAIACATYACYSYMIHKRKLDVASMYYKEIAEFINVDSSNNKEGSV